MAALNFPSNPNNGDVYGGYEYNAAKGVWVVVQGIAPATIDGLTDVSVDPAVADDHTLLYNATSGLWESSAIPASAITSGTFDVARIPTGTTSSTVSLGNHTHDDRYYTESEVITLLASLVPSGTISQYAGNAAPSGYLLCEGQNVSRTTYSSLFAAIGTAYGSGDGSTTFTLPNLKGRVPVGKDSGDESFDVLGETGGAKTHTLTISEMPNHNHSTGLLSYANGSQTAHGSMYSSNMANERFTGSTGGGGAHNNLQPYIVVNYIIKT